MTKRGLCRLDMARVLALLDAPVVYCGDVPAIAWLTGGAPDGWSWRPNELDESEKRSGVYFARHTDGTTKIGFSEDPATRSWSQKLDCVLIVAEVNRFHERLLHRFFGDERVRGEFFRGERIERFLHEARLRSRSQIRDWPCYSGLFGNREQRFLDSQPLAAE